MIRAIFALLICVLALPASATDHTPEHRILENLGNAVSPFGEKGVYELTNIISLQSTFGLSTPPCA